MLRFGPDDSYASHTGLSILQNQLLCFWFHWWFCVLISSCIWFVTTYTKAWYIAQSEVNECSIKDLLLLSWKITGILSLTLAQNRSSRKQGEILLKRDEFSICHEIPDSVNKTKQETNKPLPFLTHCHYFSDALKNKQNDNNKNNKTTIKQNRICFRRHGFALLVFIKIWCKHKDNILKCSYTVIKCSSTFWQTDSFILWSCTISIFVSISYMMILPLCMPWDV